MTASTTPSPERQPADAGGGLFMPVVEMRDDFLLKIETGETITWAEYKRRHPAPQAQPDARAWLVQEFNHDGVLRSEFAVVGDQPWSGKRGADQITTQPLYLSAPAADDGWRDMADGDWPDDGSLFQTCIWRGQPWTQQHQQWEAPQTACYRAFHPNAPGKVQLRDKDGKPIHATHWRPLPAPPVALHPAAPTDEVGKS